MFELIVLLIAVVHCDVTGSRRDVTDSVIVRVFKVNCTRN